jgi:Flp pilus assembly protein TadG
MASRIHIRSTTARRGMSCLYVMMLMPVLLGFASMGLDYARVQLSKTKLQQAADASARAAASKIPDDFSAARMLAIYYASQYSVESTPIELLDSEIEFGRWDNAARTFTKLTDLSSANAVRVTASRTEAKKNATKLFLAAWLGQSSIDTKAVSIATMSGGTTTTINVPGTSDPYLAGMPDGTMASSVDIAPAQSPVLCDAIAVPPGGEMSFSFTGAVKNNPNNNTFEPDGNLGWILSHDAGAENGIANVTMPINAQLGVFLSDEQPDLSPAPAALNFGTAESRDFSVLKPKLKQPFFIGDGMNSRGEVQRFVVPARATRFYLGTMDGFEWKNNVGSFMTSITHAKTIQIVK